MKVGGVDISTAALDVAIIPADPDGAVYHDEDWAVYQVPLLGGEVPEEAWVTACRRAHRILDCVPFDDVVTVWVERPAGNVNHLLPLFGAVVSHVPVHTSWLWPPEWRKAFCGRGDAGKDDSRKRAIELGFPTDLTEDAYEAIGIAWAGRKLTMDGVAYQKATA